MRKVILHLKKCDPVLRDIIERVGSYRMDYGPAEKESLRSSSHLRTSYMDPIPPTKSYGTHRVLRRVIAQLQFGIFQESRSGHKAGSP
jgi:hypothetical protein